MAPRHVVVDGSNIATEGRSMPSLAQLDQAVREFLTENPTDIVTVVVDASFGHRIEGSELDLFEGAEEAGELVSPPAGAIGRGDAFLLRIADKTGATVLSNDSFQEFHGDFEWLFERGRLIGGKPVPGVGWIFTPRTPVRGPRSREAVQEAKRKKRGEADPGSPVVAGMPGLDLAAERARGKGRGKGKKTVERAIAVALEEVVAPKTKPRRRRSGGAPPAEAVNDPLAFITFIAAHPLGTEVTATVESFASHGAFVEVEGARCYVPLSAMGDPPPKSAREVFAKGESAVFVIQALDPQRRGVELALPSFVKVAGAPTAETVAAEIEARSDQPGEWPEPVAEPATATARPAKRSRKEAPAPEPAASEAAAPDADGPPAKGSRGRRIAKSADAPPIDAPADDIAGAPREKAPARKRSPAKRAQAVSAKAGEKAPARKRSPAKRTGGPEAAAGSEAAATAATAAGESEAPAPVEPSAPAGRKKRAPARKADPAVPAPVADGPVVEASPVGAPGDEEVGPAARSAPRKRAPAKRAPARKGPATEDEPPAKRAPARKGSATEDEPPVRTAAVDRQAEMPERAAARTRAASRKARTEAAAGDEADPAYRSAGRTRAPAAKSLTQTGRTGGGKRVPAAVPAGADPAAEPAKAQVAKRAPRTPKSAAAVGATESPATAAQSTQPRAAAAGPGRRRAGRSGSGDGA